MNWLIPLAIVYVIGWVGWIVANAPKDALEGTVLIFTGLVWPLFALGWLVSRPFRYR